jgi:hypothetical protein
MFLEQRWILSLNETECSLNTTGYVSWTTPDMFPQRHRKFLELHQRFPKQHWIRSLDDMERSLNSMECSINDTEYSLNDTWYVPWTTPNMFPGQHRICSLNDTRHVPWTTLHVPRTTMNMFPKWHWMFPEQHGRFPDADVPICMTPDKFPERHRICSVINTECSLNNMGRSLMLTFPYAWHPISSLNDTVYVPWTTLNVPWTTPYGTWRPRNVRCHPRLRHFRLQAICRAITRTTQHPPTLRVSHLQGYVKQSVKQSYWPRARNILSAWYPIGRVVGTFSVPKVLLVVCEGYSHCLISYWPVHIAPRPVPHLMTNVTHTQQSTQLPSYTC